MEPAKTVHPYEALTPDVVLTALEQAGFPCDGRLLALNSYENRVYQVGIEDASPVIVKFYRPGRWSDEAILEEHAFALELAEHEIPLVAPMADAQGRTLLEHAGYRFAVFLRRGGHWPELDNADNRLWLGRFIGRIHAVGAARGFRHRPTLTIESFGDASLSYLQEHGFIPSHLRAAYDSLVPDLLAQVRAAFARAGTVATLRLHGDCHPGNILWTDAGPHFVDLDDARMGPAVQDLWMLLSGERDERTIQLGDLLEGYEEFRDFDPRELHLVEALRTLRLLHYSAWLARRWDDPAFPRSFPWFNTDRYWEEQVLTLREQAAALDEPPLSVYAL